MVFVRNVGHIIEFQIMVNHVNFANVALGIKLLLTENAKNVQTGQSNKEMVTDVVLIVVIVIKNYKLRETVKLHAQVHSYKILMVLAPTVNRILNLL